jgi:signal peptide peptidase SppA
MDEMFGPKTLWAMHPDYLSGVLKRGVIEAMLPDALKALSAFSPAVAKAAPDPVRDGATVIVPVTGVLSPRGNYGGGGTSTEKLADLVRGFAADDKVGAIILKISSPGGLVYGTREAGDAILEARQSKPVIAIASPMAFSAAHWLASQASRFYASPSAEVGSVGVRGGHTDMSGLEEKIGIKTTLIASSPEKIAGHEHAPLSDDDREEMQALVDEMNQEFIAAIARGRGIAPADVPAIHGSGRTFTAARAAAAGAIDGVMTLRDVVAKYGSSRSRLALMRRQMALKGQTISL